MCRVVVFLLAMSCAYASAASSPQELMKQAMEAQRDGNYEIAIRNYKEILAAYPNIPEIRSNLGAAYAGAGHYTEAIAEYQRSLKLKPNPQVHLNLALAYYKLGDLSSAVENLKAVHGKDPQNLQTLTLLSDCYLQLGQNKEVIELLTSVQKANPDNPTFNYLLGTALVRSGKVAEGQLMVDQILKNGNSAEAHMLMGTTKYMVKDFAGALAEFQQAVNLNANLPDLYSYYGMALMVTGDQAGARKAFERELQADPNNFESNLQMGVVLRQDEENEQALQYLKRALQVRPGDPGVRYQIASLELASGQVEQACRDLELLTKDSPEFLEAHVSLATVYFRQKRKADGDRERAIVAKLNAARQETNEVAAKSR
jgi:tetratricopeptide (TPR) repeat protein